MIDGGISNTDTLLRYFFLCNQRNLSDMNNPCGVIVLHDTGNSKTEFAFAKDECKKTR